MYKHMKDIRTELDAVADGAKLGCTFEHTHSKSAA
jgi:hypothetical protein